MTTIVCRCQQIITVLNFPKSMRFPQTESSLAKPGFPATCKLKAPKTGSALLNVQISKGRRTMSDQSGGIGCVAVKQRFIKRITTNKQH